MCGIVGFVDKNKSLEHGQRIIDTMQCSLDYRGPDDYGTWTDNENGIYFGHRRLSIIDTSLAGHQPMISSSGRFVIIFNGEIYNHINLRTQHQKHDFTSHSDTETLLQCFEDWGVHKTLESINGMFAIALWDTLDKKMYLTRDRAGEKPLYYGISGDVFFFGSELKPFLLHPSFKRNIDINALEAYVRKGFVPSPQSIFEGIKKVSPGTYIIIDLNKEKYLKSEIKEYWNIEKIVSNRILYNKGIENAISDFDKILEESVRRQLISDVPVGAFLSGGIDSSLIVSMMQKVSSETVKTFTIGFEEKSFNEARFAKKIANHLGTEHNELYITNNDALNIVPHLSNIYSEPFADVSQIPTILVSKLARKEVTVALSGDGGDELFCGYGRYNQAQKNWNRLSKIPYSIRNLLSNLKVHSFSEGLKTKTVDEFYHFLNKQWKGYENIVIGSKRFINQHNFSLNNDIERMMLYDFLEYLPDDILVKVDRAAMSQGLETRVPLLDKNIIEFAWNLPIEYKKHKGVDKWLLKKALNKYVPLELFDREKMGFGVPIDTWLRSSLKDWASELLSINRLEEHRLFNSIVVNKNWNDFLNGKHNRHPALWSIIIFQDWYSKLKEYKPVT